jgi:Protease inhibitor Inh
MRHGLFVAIALAISSVAPAQTPASSEAAQGMVGAWEISNAARDKTCQVTFSLDAAGTGYKLELDPACGTVFPSLKDLAVWAIGSNDSVRLMDGKGTVVLEFSEVETRMYEAERKGEGLYFMRTVAAIRAATITPEQMFGEWTLLQEFEKPLCKLTLSNASAGAANSYRIAVKPGCAAIITAFALSTWRLEDNELLLYGRSGSWRFSESDSTTWERIPPSADPLLLIRQ